MTHPIVQTAMRPIEPPHRAWRSRFDDFLSWIELCGQRRRARLVLRDAGPDLLQDIGVTSTTARAEARKPCWRR